VVKNGTTTFHVIQNHWMDPLTKRPDIYKCIKFHEVTTPSLVFATFVNTDRHVVNMNPGLKVISTFNNKLQNCISNVLFINSILSSKFFLPDRMAMFALMMVADTIMGANRTIMVILSTWDIFLQRRSFIVLIPYLCFMKYQTFLVY